MVAGLIPLRASTVTLSILAAFWAVSLLFIVTPGADWAYAISSGIRGRAFPAISGMLAGHLLATLAVAAGVGGLLATHSLALSLLTLAGAAYLLWLGANMVRHPSVPRQDESLAEGSWRRWAVKGTCVSGLNPKVFLLFLALLPQFTDPHASWPTSLQIVTLGLVHITSCAVVYGLVGFGARKVLRTRPTGAQWVSRVSGIVMIVLGTALITERVLA